MKSKSDIIRLANLIAHSVEAGHAAANASPHDGGSSNLDHVVIFGFRGAQIAAMRAAGIDCWKDRMPGVFHLGAPFAGQGARRELGVQAQAAALMAAGVDCDIHYQLD